MKFYFKQTFLELSVVLMLLMLASCSTNPVSGKQDFVTMSESQEIQLGNRYHQEIIKQYPLYDNPQLQAYIDEIGQRLAANSHRSHLDFKFYLVDSPQVNAFAVPGGHIYITRGIMAYMQDEAQLAGVIGHEIGHVTARHSVRQNAQAQLSDILSAAVAIGTGSREAAQLTSTLGGALVSGYGRENELESDRLGAEYLARSGYDAQKMIEVVGILKDQELASNERARAKGEQPRSYHGLFATHPKNDTRLQQVVNTAKQYEIPETNITNQAKFMRLMNNVTYGQSEAQGIVDEERFYHRSLDLFIQFPLGWRIQNKSDRLIAQDPNTKQAIIVQSTRLNQPLSAPQFLQRNFNGFKSGRSVRTSEDQAYAGQALVGEGENARNAIVGTVYRGKTAYVMIGLDNAKQLPVTELLQTLSSVRQLNKADKAFAKEKKLKVIRAKRGDTFAKLARRSKHLGEFAEQELRLLNDMYPEGEPKVGQFIKIVN